MSGILSQLRRVTQDLNDLRARWALIGALAVSVHTEPRTTRDIDVAITVDGESDEEFLVSQLIERGYTEKQLLMHVSPVQKMGVRLKVPSKTELSVAIDLLFAAVGIEAEIVEAAITLEVFPKLFVPIASRAHVLAMKILSQNDGDRLRDKIDVQKLLLDAGSEDIQLTREALVLIEQRGFSHGKDLQSEFLRDLQNYAPQHVS